MRVPWVYLAASRSNEPVPRIAAILMGLAVLCALGAALVVVGTVAGVLLFG